MTVVAPGFVDVVRRSELVSEESLLDALRTFSAPDEDEAAAFARHLIREQLLTSFQAKELLLGRHRRLRIETYVLRDVLGVGGMGAVYRALDEGSGQIVALKLLSERFKHDSGMRPAFSSRHEPGCCSTIPAL